MSEFEGYIYEKLDGDDHKFYEFMIGFAESLKGRYLTQKSDIMKEIYSQKKNKCPQCSGTEFKTAIGMTVCSSCGWDDYPA
jgi:hypothetical protein